MSADTAFFWEGARNAASCSSSAARRASTLRHPPGPGCGVRIGGVGHTVQSSGRGSVYSYAVHHYPPIPGFDLPNLVGLIELDEGTRIDLEHHLGSNRTTVQIGMPVEVHFEDFGDDLVLPQFQAGGA